MPRNQNFASYFRALLYTNSDEINQFYLLTTTIVVDILSWLFFVRLFLIKTSILSR